MVIFFNAFRTRISDFARKHKLALFAACIVGAIYIAPHLFFMASLGEEYRGIPMMRTANEDFYLARMQEIVDGHPSVGSPAFWEYKDEPPLSPPVGEFLYALPTLVLNIPLEVTLLVSRFVLPALLSLLVYLFIRKLMGEESGRVAVWGAIAGGLLVTLGYDLVDYRSVFGFLNGTSSPVHFLIWSRPVNPVFGAVLLFSFLLSLAVLVQNRERRTRAITLASLSLALMMGSYFFSWGVALSVLVFLALIYLCLRQYGTVGDLSLVALFGALLASPYWYAAWTASQSPWYTASALRNGLFYTHYPLLNKLLLVALAVFLVLAVVDFFAKRRAELPHRIEMWHIFSLSSILGGLWAYSQQLLTGQAVWPYHFVQYTIPLVIVAITVSLFHVRRFFSYGWRLFVFGAIFAPLIFALFVQASVYRASLPYYTKLQESAAFFDFLNRQEGDCVVLVSETSTVGYTLNGLIPAFTHCNTYNSNWGYSLMPEERILHNYLVYLFTKGVSGEEIEEYLKEHEDDARGYLFSNWKGLYRIRDFPDVSDAVVEERLAQVPDIYRAFLQKDIVRELARYRLDYVLFEGEPSLEIIRELGLSHGSPLFAENGIVVYEF